MSNVCHVTTRGLVATAERFRQKALEELGELMKGDAMTYLNDTGPAEPAERLLSVVAKAISYHWII